MRWLFALLLGCSIAQASQVPVPSQSLLPIRIPISHADPYLIMALLRGESPLSPELSAIPGFMGLGQPAAGGRSLIEGGRILFNPTDNSIWFVPDRP